MFRHALICDAVYADLPLRRRRSLHAAAAQAAVQAGFHSSYLSDQYEKAGLGPQAYEHALRAAADAVRVSAHREAAGLYQRALRNEPPDTTPGDRALLRVRLAAELAATDDNEGADRELAAAIDLYRDIGDELAGAALVPRLAAVRHLLGDGLDDRVALLQSALARLDGRPLAEADAVRAALLASLSAAYMLERRLDDAAAFGEQARSLAAEAGAAELRVNIDATIGSVLVFAGEGSEGWRLLEAALDTAVREGWEAEAARTYRMAGTSASVLVEYDRADRYIGAGLDYTARTERWNDHHYLTSHLAHVLWATGDWDGAVLAARRALADGRGGITTRVTALYSLGYVALGRGDPEAAGYLAEARALGERMQELQRLSPPIWGLAELALLSGDISGCLDLCEHGVTESERREDAAYLFPFVVTGVRALLEQHDTSGARRWLDRGAASVSTRGIPGTLPALDHAEGLIELAEGHTGHARTLLESAASGWRLRRRFWEGTHALVDLARCAERSRRPAVAADYLAEARTRAERAGAAAVLRRVNAAGRRAGEQDTMGPLSAREMEVALLVAGERPTGTSPRR
ncbi:hypothetical protein [Naasia aerilata]|uniref:Tetratricopeptide repeat protein n=1 Tax=Naasia aerilata TaxID=1162966 RepID=A0ABN6XQ48_9MICO|nr:hypothetical protein [Naasia aerilata]BDZ47149.1 hypothetical protein GCM10025866_30580 [Naasia aerilata]